MPIVLTVCGVVLVAVLAATDLLVRIADRTEMGEWGE